MDLCVNVRVLSVLASFTQTSVDVGVRGKSCLSFRKFCFDSMEITRSCERNTSAHQRNCLGASRRINATIFPQNKL